MPRASANSSPEGPLILVVEDDHKIARLVAKNLEAAGFRAHLIHEGLGVVEAVEDLAPALVVLDILLPGMDGLEITRRIRGADHLVPILMLTARASEGDKVLGFELGADDYLTKPFGTRELVARVRALVRRSGASTDDSVIRRGEIEIDPARRLVIRAGETLETTSLEFDLLHFLAARPGRVYTREALMDRVWGEGRVVDDRSIDSLVSRLRRKIEPEPSKPVYLQTVWGAGYRFSELPT